MNLLRSIRCLFGGRCVPEEAKSTGDASVPADLGQKEADLEKTGKEQMSHMEGGDVSKSAEQPTKRGPRKQRL